MLKLQQVFQLVNHRYQQHLSPEDHVVMQQQQAIRHVPFAVGDATHAARLQQGACQRLRQIAVVRQQTVRQPFGEVGHGATGIRVARRELAREQLPLVVDDRMQLAARAPAQRRFAPLHAVTQAALPRDTAIVADRQRRRVHQRAARAVPKADLHVGAYGADNGRHEGHESLVADGVGKLRAKMTEDIGQVLRGEVAKAHLVKMDHDRHDFVRCKLP